MKDSITRSRFDWKDFLKKTAVIAIPVAMQNLLTTTGSMVDTVMLAALGQNTVGAVGLCAQFSSLMFSCYWGFVGGGMLFFSQYFGARDDEGINRSYGITFTCMELVSLIFCLLAVVFPQVVMHLYTDKTVLHGIGIDYLRIVGFAYPIQVYSMCMACLLRTTGQVRIPLYGAVASVSTNIILNAILIPVWGVRGAAAATLLAAVVNVIVILVMAKLKKHPNLFRIDRHFLWNRDTVTLYFRKCFPIIMNELLIGIGNMIINIVLGRQSEQAIAALAVFRSLEGFIIGFFAGFSNATSVLVGTEVGAGNIRLAWERAKRIVYLCMVCIFAAVLFLFAIHTPLLHAMGLHDLSFDYGTGLLVIYGIACLIRMGNWTMNDTYRSAGDATTGTVLQIAFMYAMVVPLCCLTGLVWKSPFLIVFMTCYVDEPIRFLIMQRHMYSGKWIRPVTDAGRAGLRLELEEKKTSVG